MDQDLYAKAAKIISSKLVLSPWNDYGLNSALLQLIQARRQLKWMSALAKALLAHFTVSPPQAELDEWLINSKELKQAYKRSRLLQCLGASSGNDSSSQSISDVARVVAYQLSNNAWSTDAITRQLQAISGSHQSVITEVAEHLVTAFGDARPSFGSLRRFLGSSKSFQAMVRKFPVFYGLRIAQLEPAMQPLPGRPEAWRVPEIISPMELAAWLSIPPDEMWWLAQNDNGISNRAQHYRRRWSRKRSGGWRLIESPKDRLKQVQRDIAGGILTKIPTHDSAHGFCLGRNIKSFVDCHKGKRFAIRMDLRDFFPSVNRNQVAAIFRTAGYPNAVSTLLSRLTTTATPGADLTDFSRADLTHAAHFRSPHLPQGAPTSPSLANLAAYRLDCRLLGLAEKFEANYTRYADDLVFSGEDALRKSSRRFHIFALSVILEEGFRINARKTRMMPRSSRQRAAGLVFNDVPNTPRKDYELLKAVLHNCVTYGPESQNRESISNFAQHLLGRVQFHAQINPHRGKKLMQKYRQAFSGSGGFQPPQ